MKADASILIKTDLKTKFAAIPISAYGEEAPDEAAYPYITYNLENSATDGSATEAFKLDIDGWDNFNRTGSTLELETMMSNATKAIQYQQNSLDTQLGFRYFLEQRQGLTDTDPDIRRRKYVFEVRAIGKE